MEPFTSHRGKVTILDWTDVNTDLIIPARYLKRIERTGYGPLLFADKRYVPGGAPQPDQPERQGDLAPSFPLNRPEAEGATILVVGSNFGCGSSREHAVWAVLQAGFRVLIGPGIGEGFADIFEGNAYNNGLLPIELPPKDWETITQEARQDPSLEATVSLESSSIRLHSGTDPDGLVIPFEVPVRQRNRLLHGIDPIDETLQHHDLITGHEQNLSDWVKPTGKSS